jgi:hypothetical protein
MVLRVSDILGHRLIEGEDTGISTAVESVGFRRLLWFDLVMTAYLDVLGLLEEERKEVRLVYYDCRDVAFNDVGLSPRMLEAVLSEARASGRVHVLERLSDILTWLLLRGFRVSLCVDRVRAEEPGVREFLETLSSVPGDRLTIVTKSIDHGSMHKKALVTPVGILKGSANLTESGVGTNEEIIDHFFYGTAGYAQLRANVGDTFHGATRWEP